MKEYYDVLKKYDGKNNLFDLIINHSYCPNSKSDHCVEAINVYYKLTGVTTNTSCPDCVITTITSLYKMFTEYQTTLDNVVVVNEAPKQDKPKRKTKTK